MQTEGEIVHQSEIEGFLEGTHFRYCSRLFSLDTRSRIHWPIGQAWDMVSGPQRACTSAALKKEIYGYLSNVEGGGKQD